MPTDCVEVSAAVFDAAMAAPVLPPGLPDYEAAVQNYLDDYAQTKGYRDADVMATFKDSSIPAWAAEALAMIHWRDTVWLSAYSALQAYNAGQIPQPTVAQLVAQLPAHP